MSDPTERFINEENIARFADGFGREVDQDRRRVFRELLIAEEYRLGSQSWHMELAEAHIARAQSLIERQSSLIAGSPMNDRELQQANLLLRNCLELQKMFEEFRTTLARALDRGMI